MEDAAPDNSVKVYDISGESPAKVTIAPEHVDEGVSSGQFSFPKGQDIKVLDPDGEPVTIAPEYAPEAFKQGFKYATPEIQNHIKYGSGMEQVKAGLEGFAEGVAGPIAPYLETRLGVRPEDIRGRAEEHPWTHGLAQAGGLTGGLFTGTGEGALLEMAGKGAVEAAGLGLEGASTLNKIGASGLKAATEMGLMSGSDETTKMITNDPEAGLHSAMANVGLSALLGGVGGVALGSVSPLWKATAGDRLGTFFTDLKGGLNESLNNPNPIGAATEEASNLYKTINSVNDATWGSSGIKAQAIQNTIPEMNNTILKSTEDLAGSLNSKVLEMRANPDVYPTRLVNQFETQVNRILESVTDPNASPAKIFDAVQTTKQWAQDASKNSWKYGNFDVEKPFADEVSKLSKTLRPYLENPKVWGEAGKAQQVINKAASEFFPTLSDWEKKFTTKLLGEQVIDPTKIATYMNQLGKPNAEIKQEVMKNLLEKGEAFRKVVSDQSAKLGIENPFPAPSLTQLNKSISKLTPGQKLADLIVKKGLSDIAGKGVGGAVGAAAGSVFGHPLIGAAVGEHTLGPFFSKIMPSIAKPFLEKSVDAEAMKATVDYGTAIAKGNRSIENGVKALFKPGLQLGTIKSFSEKEAVKLDKKLKDLQSNNEPLMDVGGKTAYYLPHHGMQIGQTAGNAIQYLNSIRPVNEKKAPLDSKAEVSAPVKAEYNRALEIAEQPLVVIHSMKDGTLTPQDVTHLKSLYPGLYRSISMNIMDQLSSRDLDSEPIPYKQRLTLSLFMGEPLDSTMTQQAIQSVQMQSMPQQPQQAQAPAVKPTATGMDGLKKMTAMYQTPQQARIAAKAT